MNPDNQLSAVLAHLIKQMGDAAAHYGPQALSLAGAYLQLNAILELGFDFVMLGVVAGAYWFLWKLSTPVRAQFTGDAEEPNEFLMFGGSTVSVIVALLLLIAAVCVIADLLTPSTWLSAFSAKMALVAQAMSAVSK